MKKMKWYKGSKVKWTVAVILTLIIAIFAVTKFGLFTNHQSVVQNDEQDNVDLYIYSSRQESIIGPILKQFAFSYEYNIKILYVSNGLLERIRQESILSKGDVIISSDLPLLITAAKERLLLPVNDPFINSVVPKNLRATTGEWIGLSKRIRLVYTSINRVGESDIKDYQDIADPKYKGKVCVRSGYHNYNLSLFSAFASHFGEDKLKAFASSLKSNLAFKPTGNDRYQVKAIWQGKCDISLGNSYYYGLMLKNEEQKPWADSVRPVFASIGKYGNHINVSGAGILQSSKNVSKAIELLQFLLSRAIQKQYTSTTYEYPIRTDVDASDLVKSWGDINPDKISLQEVAENRTLTLRILKEVDFDG